jgi:uncharacterized membrane protein
MYIIQTLNLPDPAEEQQGEYIYGDLSLGTAVNAEGDVAGTAQQHAHNLDLPYTIGAIWRSDTTIYSFDPLASDPPDFSDPKGYCSAFNDMNNLGDAVGGHSDPLDTTGPVDYEPDFPVLVRHDGTYTDYSSTFGKYTYLVGINDKGLICGYPRFRTNGFVFDSLANTMTEIPILPGNTNSFPSAINQAGDVVGGDNGHHGFLYRGAALTDLGSADSVDDISDSSRACGTLNQLPGTWNLAQASPVFSPIARPALTVGGHAHGLNNWGDVVGTCWTADTFNTSKQTAFVYNHSTGAATDLNTLLPPGSGWRLVSAQDINDDGQITGWGFQDGYMRAFLLTPLRAPNLRGLGAVLIAQLIFGGVAIDAGGTAVLPGGHPVPVDPWGARWAAMPREKRNILVGLALEELASHVEDSGARAALSHTSLELVRSQVDRLLQNQPRQAATVRHRGAAPQTLRLEAGRLPQNLATQLHGQQLGRLRERQQQPS